MLQQRREDLAPGDADHFAGLTLLRLLVAGGKSKLIHNHLSGSPQGAHNKSTAF